MPAELTALLTARLKDDLRFGNFVHQQASFGDVVRQWLLTIELRIQE